MKVRKSILSWAVGAALAGTAAINPVFAQQAGGEPVSVESADVSAPWAMSKSEAERLIRDQFPNSNIASVMQSPIPGLYEVVAGSNVFYVQPGQDYIIAGHIFDTNTQRDLTAERKRELGMMPQEGEKSAQAAQQRPAGPTTTDDLWDRLPASMAITSGPENAPAIAVFTDPACPHCRRFERLLPQMGNLRVYRIVLPLSPSQQAKRLAAQAMCANDPEAAFKQLMNGQGAPEVSDQECLTKAQQQLATNERFAAETGIRGTPFFVRPDGDYRMGFNPQGFAQWAKGGK